ncbi:Imm63 family immunity protein [Rhodospirillum sp. A1_3_36]|uniref:Imm63 family immunity protein n=1 Tax=Rhodospirillum sp. A1_3_36 TaxID=3391666 RepID=UPI0039A40280
MNESIEEIQSTVLEIASKIDAPKTMTTIFSKSPQDGRPHIEIKKGKYRLLFEERGFIFFEKETDSLNVLLFWIFRSITSQMAQDYELRHRVEHQDPRRILFAKQLDLMKIISLNWYHLMKDEIEKTIEESPFMD